MPKTSIATIFDDVTPEPEPILELPATHAASAAPQDDLKEGKFAEHRPPRRNSGGKRQTSATETDDGEQTRRATAVLPVSLFRALLLELHARNSEALLAGECRTLSMSGLMAELLEDSLSRAARKRKGGGA